MPIQKNIIDQVFPETLKILSNLIKFQTVSGSSNLELIEYCEEKLKQAGATSFKTFNNSGSQANLFSTIKDKNSSNGKGIILSGHTDVVPAVSKEWTSDPYIAREKDDKLQQRDPNWEFVSQSRWETFASELQLRVWAWEFQLGNLSLGTRARDFLLGNFSLRTVV